MYQEKIKSAIKQLTIVSAFLGELLFYFNEVDAPSISEKVERFLDQFDVTERNVDLQQNSENTENPLVWTKKEMKELPYLKDLKFRYKNGIYEYRYRRNGYNESFSSKNPDVAKKKAYDFIADLKRILRTEAENVRTKTLDNVASAWLELKKAHTSKTTSRVYTGIYYNHIKPIFGNRAVKNILPMDLQPFFNELFAKQEKTCEDAKIVLNGIFKYAVANRLCPTNPMDGVIVEKHFRNKGQAMNDEQIKRFKSVMLNAPCKLGLAGLIILYTGIRGAELQSLKFDWTNGTFTVENAKLKKSQKTNPGNLFRTVPIFPALYTLKDRIESEQWKLASATLSSKLSNLWTECTIKDLRHTFASKAREAGVDNELVNIWMGHSAGVNLTANTYTHFSMNFQQKEAKKITNY
jgi:integrase